MIGTYQVMKMTLMYGISVKQHLCLFHDSLAMFFLLVTWTQRRLSMRRSVYNPFYDFFNVAVPTCEKHQIHNVDNTQNNQKYIAL